MNDLSLAILEQAGRQNIPWNDIKASFEHTNMPPAMYPDLKAAWERGNAQARSYNTLSTQGTTSDEDNDDNPFNTTDDPNVHVEWEHVEDGVVIAKGTTQYN